ncbi:MAG: copper resistance protein [Proteobacteria bacterium]|jgi:suppressor for copper-sensitivity B|nr:protein-disulfide reductase DsbD family protein [Alphaproteobacteria bacterium]NCC02452.1 copper resistance protein [Pseudomonadota bacterium]
MPRFLIRFAALFVLFFLGAINSGQASDSFTAPELKAQLKIAPSPRKDFDAIVGLDLQLADGWHAYWRSPGDTGEPIAIDWTGSENIENPTLLFPAPQRFQVEGGEIIGYDRQVVFPIGIKIPIAEQSITLKADINILLCKDICLPLMFQLDLAAPTLRDVEEVTWVKDALRAIPSTENAVGLAIKAIRKDNHGYTIDATSPTALNDPDLFLEEGDNRTVFLKPEISYTNERKDAQFVVAYATPPEKQSTSDVRATLVDKTDTGSKRALEVTLTPTAQATKAPSYTTRSPSEDTAPPSLLFILLLSILGGFILNLMPCVLPVLSLKIMAAIRHRELEHRAIRHSFLSTALGIVCSFLLLALLTIGLRHIGLSIGWGIQFQQPLFLILMIMLLTFFAANMWGFFELNLPRFIMDNLDTTQHPRLAGDFATGFLATLLATPCTAPFLGTAIGFALTAGAYQTLAIFALLGIGMATPYLLIAAVPRLATVLPKPGRWMMVLTHLLGAGILGTALWLTYVLQAQIGQLASLLVLGGVLLVLLLSYWRHHAKIKTLFTPLIATIMAGAIFLVHVSSIPAPLQNQSGLWQQFDESKIEQAIKDGKIVFVDITADWCLNCKYNKRFVLSDPQIVDQLADKDHVLAMQGDWTNPDPAITAYLHKHGRYGIPFNAVYGPRAPDGILLPELLTKDAVQKAIDSAAAPACSRDLPHGKTC